MSFLRKALDRIVGKNESRKLTEEEILKAIDDLAEQDVKNMSPVEMVVKDEEEEKLVKVPAPKLWSTYKYLSSMGTDENGEDKLFFVLPISMHNTETEKNVRYMYFPLNGTYLDIVEKTVNI